MRQRHFALFVILHRKLHFLYVPFYKIYNFFFEMRNSLNQPKGQFSLKVAMSLSTIFFIVLLNILLLPFTKVRSHINQLKKDYLGKSFLRTLNSKRVQNCHIGQIRLLGLFKPPAVHSGGVGMGRVHGRGWKIDGFCKDVKLAKRDSVTT